MKLSAMKIILMTALLLYPTFQCRAQNELQKQLSGAYNANELVTISKDASFDEAIATLNSVSQYNTGKSILSSVSLRKPIGIDIDRVSYIKALNMIVNLFDLRYEENESRIVIMEKGRNDTDNENQQVQPDLNTYADTDAREISISAVFFDADVQKSRERGIDWKTVLSYKEIGGTADLLTKSTLPAITYQTQAIPPKFNLSGSGHYRQGALNADVTALFRFFEEENLGEIIASPSITVRDRQKGRIQVGSDFSIKQRDFSGNIIDKFYSAGSIIDVTPYIYRKNDMLYSLLKINVERSSFFPSELTTEVKKTSAVSDVLLLNGEETVIGGLFVNEETVIRNGIPFLKDLPWWFLGIRYLTGSDQKVIRKKEVIILIRAEILPTLEERFRNAGVKGNEKLKQTLKENEQDMQNYRQNYKDNYER